METFGNNRFFGVIFKSSYILKIYMEIFHMKFLIWDLPPNRLVCVSG